MFWKQPRPSFVTAYLASILGLFASSLPILAQDWPTPPVEGKPGRIQPASPRNREPIYTPPDRRGAPSRREGGGTRGGPNTDSPTPPVDDKPGRTQPAVPRDDCLLGEKPLTALIPETGVGLTTAAYPTIFFYIPPTSAKQAEFVLRDENNREIYQTRFRIPSNSGVIGVSIPPISTSPGLEVGKNYRWNFSLVCNSQDRAKDKVLQATIQRVQLPQDIVVKIEKATMRDRATLYADNGIWYDALSTLAQQRRDNPNDSQLAKDWAILLRQVGLQEIAEEPLVETNSLP